MATIKNSSFLSNSAVSNGGAINIASTKGSLNLMIEGCVFDSNTAPNGGAISVVGYRGLLDGCYLQLVDCLFINNSATLGGICIFGKVV